MKQNCRRRCLLPLAALLLVAALAAGALQFRAAHTFRLADEPADAYVKSEQIRPVFGWVKVWGTQDTDVWFIDAEDPSRRFQIGYLTPGMPQTIQLERGRWYDVQGAGKLTVSPVEVRITDRTQTE